MKFPIPADWDGESWCKWSVCWPESEQWEGFLRGLLTLPQRGRTWDERTGSILNIQAVGREITALNLPLVGVVMACNDTGLQEALSEIALALRYAADREFAKPCCGDSGAGIPGGAGYSGQTVQPIGGNTIPIYGTQPPASLPEGEEFPDGFESFEEWDAHKCAIANLIFDGVIYSVAFLASLNTTNITVLAGLIGAGIAGILVFPPVGLAIMVGAVAALFGFLAMFLEIRNEMLERRQEFVCAMYEAESVESAIAVLADLMDLIIALVTTVGPLAAALKTILLLLFNGDALNQLFDATADYAYPDADCQSCLPCERVYDEFELSSMGWVSTVAMPSCFGLTNNGAAGLSWTTGILAVAISGGSPNPNGAIRKTGLDYYVSVDSHVQVGLRSSGTTGIYIDAIIEFLDGSCYWVTLSNNHAASGTFAGISRPLAAHAGKTVTALYLWTQSSGAGPDNSYLVEFNGIGFTCD